MSVQINFNGEDALEAIRELSVFASHLTSTAAAVPVTAAAPAAPAPQLTPPAPTPQPYQAPAIVQGYTPQYSHQPPVQQEYVPPVQPQPSVVPTDPQPPVQPNTTTVPVSTQSYTQEQIAVAATALCEAGQQEAVLQLLAQYGGPPLTAVSKEHYGALATGLRGLGAKI